MEPSAPNPSPTASYHPGTTVTTTRLPENKTKRKNRRGKESAQAAFIRDLKGNPLEGNQPMQIIRTSGGSANARKYVANAAYNLDVRPGDVVYKAAIHKFKAAMSKKHESVSKLDDYTFACVIACDNLVAGISAIGSALYSAYQNPHVKKFVDDIVSAGYNKAKDWIFSGSKQQVKTDLTGATMGHYQADSVNLGYCFGALSRDATAISDPRDIPRVVYTNRATGEVTLPVNSSGNAICILRFNRCATSSSTYATSAFQSFNTSAGYDPEATTTSGTWQGTDGPITSQYSNISQLKVIGASVEVLPFVSTNEAEGGYVAGFLPSQMSTPANGSTFTVYTIPFSQATEIPYATVCNMRTPFTTRMWPSTEKTRDDWAMVSETANPAYDHGTFYIIVKGADPSATIALRWSMVYSVMTNRNAQNWVRGKIPEMGPYSDQFLEYIRSRYPNIVNWAEEDVARLFSQFLKAGTDRYSELVNLSEFEPPPLQRQHRLTTRNRAQRELGILEPFGESREHIE